ncbi:CRISPR-associated endonuclease Cas3-HD [Actinomyces johnsonii F0542]|uniref:CRISPR-associated endonuclease Cas3-HD n=1 Tax=Actinomyces johnsonii F0542 TaxID=1321818 RepID=U1QHF4_9ACTO|nr:type I-U CRISPR-associated helicase/endonuclease Cas3 [Actinomyces johnsonii]ERH21304.1 CRISPR-associated endonuclease Cas3-HD [Actinomyces johnsonii F0542]
MNRLDFTDFFREITGHEPRDYQVRLAERLASGEPPSHLSVPTGMGKTFAVLLGWLYALAQDAEQASRRRRRRVVPLRLHLVVDRRAVVDDSFEAAQTISKAIGEGAGSRPAVQQAAEALRSAFAIPAEADVLEVRRLRGGLADADRDLTEHTRYPSRPAIIVGTLDMTVSRLLFRGYQLSPYRRSIDAALTGMDAFWVLDEAHLSGQALTTLSVLRSEENRLEDRCGGSVPGLQIMPMTATPMTLPTLHREADQESAPGLSLDWEEECRLDPQLAARRAHRDSVPVDVHCVNGKAAAALTEQACTRMKELSQGESLVVFCNTLDTVKKVVAGLKKEIRNLGDQAPRLDVMVGGMPARRSEDAVKRLSPYRTGAEGRQDAQATVVVATSTLEVGADLDFTHLLTESCQAGSLVQRLGRVNRVGARSDGSVAIVHSTTSKDPIHGGAADAVVDLIDGATTLGEVVKRLDEVDGREELVNATQVPVVIPPNVFAAYLRTMGSRNDAPVHPWIRRLADPRPDAFIVFRKSVGDLAGVSPEALQEDLTRWRPDLRAEAWSVPLSDARDVSSQALKKQALVIIDPTTEDTPRIFEAGVSLPDLVPGQIIVMAPGKDSNPYGLEGAGRDYSGQHVMPGATAEEVSKELVSLATGTDQGPGWRQAAILTDLSGGDVRTDDPYADLLEEAALLAVPPGWQIDDDVIGADSRHPWLHLRLVEAATERPVSTEDDADERTLCGHGDQVGERAGQWARAIGLPENLVEDLVTAGRHHDDGKADSRMQAALGAAVDESGFLLLEDPGQRKRRTPLSKSRLPRRYWNRSMRMAGVPSGWRHEAASADYLEEQLERAEQTAHDPDLVMHLVLSHHGRFRGPGPVCLPEHGTTPRHQNPNDPSWAEAISRFHRLNDRYGPYTLALIETILRLADWDVSQELEQNHE